MNPWKRAAERLVPDGALRLIRFNDGMTDATQYIRDLFTIASHPNATDRVVRFLGRYRLTTTIRPGAADGPSASGGATRSG